MRADGGQVDAGLARLRCLGRLPLSVPITTSPLTPASTEPVHQRGRTEQWVERMLKTISSKGFEQHDYVDQVLQPRKPHVGRGRLINLISNFARESPSRGNPSCGRVSRPGRRGLRRRPARSAKRRAEGQRRGWSFARASRAPHVSFTPRHKSQHSKASPTSLL